MPKPHTTRLSGKVALVTGGARGIGAAIVKRLSDEGAAVAITYSASKQAAEALVSEINRDGGNALAIRADSAVVEEVKTAVANTVKTFGRLDILVNNAAKGRTGTIETYPLNDLDEMIAVNIKGLFVATQEALRYLGEGGRIINIGSISGDYAPMAGISVYAMTKGAVASLTRGLARELGPRGITVNNVQPGRIDTEMMRDGFGPALERVRQAIPLQRFGTTDEVAGLVAYLSSSEAAFINGANLRVDGGASV
jgi:3-oxoacyl-[acyl-carrier protein] reductase